MVQKSAEAATNWCGLFVVALTGTIALVALYSFCDSDIALLVNLLLVVPLLLLTGIAFLIYAAIARKWRQHLAQLSYLAIALIISVSFLVVDATHPVAIRSAARWLIWSRQYKNEVLAQPSSAGGFQHLYWDGWGMFAQDTSVYLVFDPKDSLSAAAKTQRAGKFDGIPCGVASVHRLEKHWYEVIFYTDEEWGSCNAGERSEP